MKSAIVKAFLTAASLATVSGVVAAADMQHGGGMAGHESMHMNHDSMKMDMQMHMHMHADMNMPITHRKVSVNLPGVMQTGVDGKQVKFVDAINDGRPVVLNFIFTTCTAICPISSSTFMQLQKKLGKEYKKVHLVSISIDPDQDTPSVLSKYAKEYHAKPGWDFYTGSASDSISIQQAFDVYRGDKMSHDPVTFVRTKPGSTWTRVDGFATANTLLQDYRKSLAEND